jgi:hypothetical protein
MCVMTVLHTEYMCVRLTEEYRYSVLLLRLLINPVA